jgi:TusA-related sulfurtransferase
LLIIRRAMASLAPGEVLEIRSVEPTVREDLPAWYRLVGHQYLGAWPGPQKDSTAYCVRQGDQAEDDQAATAAYRWRVRVAALASDCRQPPAPTAQAFSRNQQWLIGGTASYAPAVPAPSAGAYVLGALGTEIVQAVRQTFADHRVPLDALEFVGDLELHRPLAVTIDEPVFDPPRYARINGTLCVSTSQNVTEIDALWAMAITRCPPPHTLQPVVPRDLRWTVIL